MDRVEKVQAGALDQDVASAELLGAYEARIAALERLVGRSALEIEPPQRGSEKRAVPEERVYSVITGLEVSPLSGGAR